MTWGISESSSASWSSIPAEILAALVTSTSEANCACIFGKTKDSTSLTFTALSQSGAKNTIFLRNEGEVRELLSDLLTDEFLTWAGQPPKQENRWSNR